MDELSIHGHHCRCYDACKSSAALILVVKVIRTSCPFYLSTIDSTYTISKFCNILESFHCRCHNKRAGRNFYAVFEREKYCLRDFGDKCRILLGPTHSCLAAFLHIKPAAHRKKHANFESLGKASQNVGLFRSI